MAQPNQPKLDPAAKIAGGSVTTDAASAILPSAIPKKWLLGLAILLAVVIGIHWIRVQSYENSWSASSARSIQQSCASAPVPTKYPIIKWVKVHRSSWSEPIVVSEMEQMSWICYDSVPILVSDDGQVYRQAISSHLDTKGVRDHRTTRFMIDPNAYPAVVETTMECTITAR